jgi:hypothetical protein
MRLHCAIATAASPTKNDVNSSRCLSGSPLLFPLAGVNRMALIERPTIKPDVGTVAACLDEPFDAVMARFTKPRLV